MPLRTIRDRLTYANVMATLAVFIALGGSSYAALKIGSKEIRNNSIRSVDVRNKTLRGKDIRDSTLTGRHVRADKLGGGAIKESSLAKVPAAVDADRVGGRTAEELRVACPGGTVAISGVCLEAEASVPQNYLSAATDCQNRGRQLPPYPVLAKLVETLTTEVAPGGEFTSAVFESRDADDRLDVVVVTTDAGNASYVSVISPTTKAYRCMALPAN